MATSHDDMKLTFRKFEDGVDKWDSWEEKIFVADTSYKCPTYVHKTPPCQGSCPSGEDIRGWLGIMRLMETPPASYQSLYHIHLAVAPDAKARAAEVVKRINKGEQITALSAELSENGSAKKSGDLGRVSALTDENLKTIARKLKVRKPEIVENENGVDIFMIDVGWQEFAFRRATTANPFPSQMGRVCPAPCQDGCNRNEVDDFVGINAVEQFIGDYAYQQGFQYDKPTQEFPQKIAIIGGGPAGLAAAYQLRKKGYGCTIFDDHEDLGGMMRYGIPGYRNPREILSAEIQRIINMGRVEIKTKTRVGTHVSVETLEQEYDAVLWAIGCKAGRPLPVPGSNAPNCISGVAFLEAFNQGRLKFTAKKVVCVGGGDTSIDVVSVARRLGHILTHNPNERTEQIVHGHTAHDVTETAVREGAQATLTSLFPKDQMTAAEHEVSDATREGVTIIDGVMPLEVILNDEGRAIALKMAKCTVVKGRPEVIPDTEFQLEADLIVSAIGQGGDMTGLEAFNNGRGLINADKNFCVPGKEKHFVCGDIVRPHLLTTAIGQASIAADSIEQFLNHQELSKRPKVDVHHFNLLEKLKEDNLAPEDYQHQNTDWGTANAKYAVHNYEDRSLSEIIPADELFLGHFGYEARYKRKEIVPTAEEVLGHFEERVLGYSADEVISEAKRCMSCGMCFECDNCVIFCPQTAVFKVNPKEHTTGRYVDTNYSRCIGCHICSDVCPTGYIKMGLGA